MNGVPLKYVAVFGLGLLVMFLAQGVLSQFALCNQRYDLLSPARRCHSTMPQGEWNYEPLRNALLEKKEELKASGAVTHVSIYFQDLDHGPRFGIGEYDQFQPVSLLKLPLAIYFLHAADLNPGLLDQTLSFTNDLGVEANTDFPDQSILPDTPYAIRDLLTKMIVYSDNRSYAVLLREMNRLSRSSATTAYNTFRDLDVLQMMLKADTTYVSISAYAKLYAVLYNTGYLSKDMSQFALQMLSETTFDGGIVGGVPAGTRVANKFGFADMEGED